MDVVWRKSDGFLSPQLAGNTGVMTLLMARSQTMASLLRFRDFTLDVRGYQLRRDGRPVRLERQPMDLLILLVERYPELVSRDEIVNRLWGKDVFIDVETGVHGAIRKVRRALRDSPDRPVFVETVPGRGYRFIAPVEVVTGPSATPAAHDTGNTAEPAVASGTGAPGSGSSATASVPHHQTESGSGAGRSGSARALAGTLAFAVLAGLLLWHWHFSTSTASRVTLAVLPFENLSGDPDRSYLGDGLAEEIVIALDKIDPQRVDVVGRLSMRGYQRTTKPPGEIGRELGADYLVDSSIRAERGRLRITATLIRVRDQVQVWSESYDREPGSVFELQRELSRAIADQIRLRLSPDRLDRLGRRQTRNPEAYDLYLRGRDFANQRTPLTNAKAIEYFQHATTLDSNYALAWSGLAMAHAAGPINSDAAPLDRWPRAREAAREAVRADRDLAEAQAAQGYVDWIFEWDWPSAETALRRAASLDSKFAVASQQLGHVLSQMGRHGEAEPWLRSARELDPLYAMPFAMSSQVAFQARDYPAALGYARQALALDSEFWIGNMVRGQALERMGQHDEALEALTAAARFSDNNSKALALRGYVLAKTRRTEDARDLLKLLEAASQQRYVPPYALALIHAGLGERGAVFEWLDRAYAARDVHLIFLPVDPKWDPYRGDPRFVELLARCNFVPAKSPK